MSWSIVVPGGAPGNFEEATNEAVAKWRESYPNQATEESLEQINVAKETALAIVRSGCVGDGWIGASLSGHSNPGHKPREGWGLDTTGVYVNRVPTPEEPG